MASTPDGAGYWLVASDGGIFTFGDAAFYGSMGGDPPRSPPRRIASQPSGKGYWIIDQNGTANPSVTPRCSADHRRSCSGPSPPATPPSSSPSPNWASPTSGGATARSGYDCSGLALASWEHAAGIGFARVADDQYHTAGPPVALTSLVAGDLVFWGTSQTDWTTVYHTALYVGGGRIVEATGDHVQLELARPVGAGDLMPNGRRP